ncbi:hypothetical protein GCM10020001_052930 [Nonomuraea salmonea]
MVVSTLHMAVRTAVLTVSASRWSIEAGSRAATVDLLGVGVADPGPNITEPDVGGADVTGTDVTGTEVTGRDARGRGVTRSVATEPGSAAQPASARAVATAVRVRGRGAHAYLRMVQAAEAKFFNGAMRTTSPVWGAWMTWPRPA